MSYKLYPRFPNGSFSLEPIKELERYYLKNKNPIIRCIMLLTTIKKLYEDEIKMLKTVVKPLVKYFSAASKNAIKYINTFNYTKNEMIQKIDLFIGNIEKAQIQIIDNSVKNIKTKNYKNILIFGNNPLINKIVCSLGSEYKIYICIDCNDISSNISNIEVKNITYLQLNALSYVLSNVDVVLLGCIEIMSNGDMKGPIGTALVGMVSSYNHIPVIVCCETISITKRVETSVEIKEVKYKNFKKYSLEYDITPSKYISQIITEKGIIHPSCVYSLF